MAASGALPAPFMADRDVPLSFIKVDQRIPAHSRVSIKR
jgi:hypothetical protein